MAAPSTVITTIKSLTYRGNPAETWTNTYAFTGTTPADSTAWRALFDALVLQEKTVITNQSQILGAYGYNRIPVKGDHAIYTLDLRLTGSAVTGTLSTASGALFAGDQASWVRWGLDRFNTNGKRVYLRKYYHAGLMAAGGGDGLTAAYITALTTFAGKMDDGTLLGSRRICDKDGNTPIGHAVSTYVTTRTLKRRGKRPPRAAS